MLASSSTVLTTIVLDLICLVAAYNCPENQTYDEACWVVSREEANWIGAKRYCNALGGALAVPDFSSEHDYMASMIRSTNKERHLTFHTPNNYSYRYLEDEGLSIIGHSFVKFTVKACNDVHLALSSTKGNSTVETYEIVLGGWADSESVIRDCMQCAAKAIEYERVLDCNQARPFWLSWQYGELRLGKGGVVGEQTILSWQDPTPHDVNHLAIATGWGSTGDWVFTVSTYNTGMFWMGATDLLVEGEWARGAFDPIEARNMRWGQGQPSGGQGRHCAAMDLSSNLTWKDENCEAAGNFVCMISL